MTNKEIARTFNLLGKVMELHDENPFKIRSYTSAYVTLRKIENPLIEMSREALDEIPGVGKAIAEKILELQSTGQINTLERFLEKTPVGIQEMLQIKGFGPKKIKVIWKEMGIETLGELMYAIEENRLVKLKGFGTKTQETLKKQLEYFMESKGKSLYAYIEPDAIAFIRELEGLFPMELFEFTGALRRKDNIVDGISLVSTVEVDEILSVFGETFTSREGICYYKEIPVEIISVDEEMFYSELFLSSGSDNFLRAIDTDLIASNSYMSEEDIFEDLGMQFIEPEMRETAEVTDLARNGILQDLITLDDIRGVVHNHSTYSDGMNSIKEMADYCIEKGFEYLVMSDHSKAAFYANGLDEDRCMMQFREIDKLNESYEGKFKVFKSIECDILNDGSLDYSDDFLKEFDLVICSVHSNLKMDKEKANNRLLRAVAHPSCHILGHMTGRLLLSREGYPIDHKRIIDACAENNTVIELNANPARLDMDWKWIDYALRKNVMIAINPDAHARDQIDYIHFGVCSARKGGLTANQCLNTKSLEAFQSWVDQL